MAIKRDDLIAAGRAALAALLMAKRHGMEVGSEISQLRAALPAERKTRKQKTESR